MKLTIKNHVGNATVVHFDYRQCIRAAAAMVHVSLFTENAYEAIDPISDALRYRAPGELAVKVAGMPEGCEVLLEFEPGVYPRIEYANTEEGWRWWHVYDDGTRWNLWEEDFFEEDAEELSPDYSEQNAKNDAEDEWDDDFVGGFSNGMPEYPFSEMRESPYAPVTDDNLH